MTDGLALREFTAWFGGWVAALNSYDVDALLELVTEDIEWRDPAMFGKTVCGRHEFRRFVDASLRAFPDVRFVAIGAPYTATDGSGFAVRWRITATFTGAMEGWAPLAAPTAMFAPTGRQIQSEGIDLYELRQGRLHRWTVVYDVFDVSVQAGLAPSPHSRLVRVAAAGQRLLARIT
jgi:ketosteroid isomerase-like protein